MEKKIKILLFCGGPSPERSISLNSTRSVLDNLDHDIFSISVVYFDLNKKPYVIPNGQIYSNTVFDFEFKIKSIGKYLERGKFEKLLKDQDLIWPIMHGELGEDGEIQKILEKAEVCFVGSPSRTCEETIDKYKAQEKLAKNGFFTWGSIKIKKGEKIPKLARGKYVVKPNSCGSSIGVYFPKTRKEMARKLEQAFRYDKKQEALIERFCPGREFTLIILENRRAEPVPLIPTEVQFNNDDKFFSFRKKYLASNYIHFHTPPRFSKKIMEKIRLEAKQVYKLFGFRDYARFDGWVMPDGKIWFSDLNSITGMEQNSFVFRQAAFAGMSHADILNYIISAAAGRYGRKIAKILSRGGKRTAGRGNKKKVAVVFGGETAERQISLLSGTNVWIKLKSSAYYLPAPIFMDRAGEWWLIPHFFCLHHTVEEIEYLIKNWDKKKIKRYKGVGEWLGRELGLDPLEAKEPLFLPRRLSVKQTVKRFNFIFLALHGGIGEDGTLQKALEALGARFNGSDSPASKIGMDKLETGRLINKARVPGLKSLKKKLIKIREVAGLDKKQMRKYWRDLKKKFKGKNLLFKPRSDGCSAGVAKINNADEFRSYVNHLRRKKIILPAGLLKDHAKNIELPVCLDELLAEEFIETDEIKIKGTKISWNKNTGWIEISAGVLGNGEKIKALTPSQTIARGRILSVEEKFQGGTGVNFTPPPEKYIAKELTEETKDKLRKAALILGIQGYGRIDCFLNLDSREAVIIEANTLPALTPSTIIYHQALKEIPRLKPLNFLEKIIQLGFEKNRKRKRQES